ncbi:unnamed protein product [Trichogramma brassicae]|uniref:Uncharacterized protein n=1 Tax=Trichogramma brassicae TaxID=86971 RepID=A0A6H5I1C5_9HYME|nr:unnamed protein product [Trichogramma brassicae]
MSKFQSYKIFIDAQGHPVRAWTMARQHCCRIPAVVHGVRGCQARDRSIRKNNTLAKASLGIRRIESIRPLFQTVHGFDCAYCACSCFYGLSGKVSQSFLESVLCAGSYPRDVELGDSLAREREGALAVRWYYAGSQGHMWHRRRHMRPGHGLITRKAGLARLADRCCCVGLHVCVIENQTEHRKGVWSRDDVRHSLASDLILGRPAWNMLSSQGHRKNRILLAFATDCSDGRGFDGSKNHVDVEVGERGPGSGWSGTRSVPVFLLVVATAQMC